MLKGKKIHMEATLPWVKRLSLAQEFVKREQPAIITNEYGSWYRSLAALKQMGLKKATVVIPRFQDFLLTRERTAVVVEEKRLIFLPVYKCGTSSFRALAHKHFAEFSERNPHESTALNTTIDPLSEVYADYQSFSFIREPMDRFGSFFRDKILVPEGSRNAEYYAEPIKILMDSGLTAKTIAEFISLIPPEYCDPHFKPQWMTLHFENQLLAKHIFRLGDTEALRTVGIQHELPRALSTKSRKSVYEEDDTIPAAQEIVERIYRRDYHLLPKVGSDTCQNDGTHQI